MGCGLNAAAKTTEAAAVEASRLASQAHDASTIFLVKTMGIYNSDGSEIDDPKIARIIADAYKSDSDDIERIQRLAEILNLDASEFVENRERHKEMEKFLEDYRK